MARLKAFLKGDEFTPSSVGYDQVQRKYIRPTKNDSKTAAQTMYVRECLSHQNGSVIPLDLYRRIKNEYVKVAEGLACPLCWIILKRVEDPTRWKSDEPLEVGIDDDKIRLTSFKK
jgi:hypothetical protein